MKWHVEDIPFLLHFLPRALHDLAHHEDAALAGKATASVAAKPAGEAVRHHIAPAPADRASPDISIEKTLDPMAQRAAQNIGLLLHDYLNQLPDYDVSGAEAEKLLEHWREILLEQPQRLAAGHQSNWHDDKTKSFWREKLASQLAAQGISDSQFIDAWDDWQRAAGVGHATGHPLQLQAMEQKKWQDLVIRTRLHQLTVSRTMDSSGVLGFV